MASDQESSSSNSCNSDSTQRTCKYDIFLSFGEDTRKGFTDHLYHALKRSGFRVFRDDDELEREEVISKELEQAIEDSQCAIVVLSKNYVSSSWCLNELGHILYSRDNLSRQVFPIFYDVRHQREIFAEAFAGHQMLPREVMESWMDSLKKVSNLSGWDCKDSPEAKLIIIVVEELWTKLRSKELIGVNNKVELLKPLLEIGLKDVRFVGIWGLPGVGKTTIARAIFEKYCGQFEISCFLHNVRTASERVGEIHLQSKLLSHLKIGSMKIEDTCEGKEMIQNHCCDKKVLLILDDVSHTTHLEILANSPNWFGAGSRVIITTQHLDLLCRVHETYIYEVGPMDPDESLQLFCQKAFGRDEPREDLFELSKTVCDHAKGCPLALSVLGSFFRGRSSTLEWEDALDMLNKDPHKDIFTILQISFDALTDTEQHIFLDIACFLNHGSKNLVTQMLESFGFNSKIEITSLCEKSLLMEYENILVMHDLLEQMGRRIVLDVSSNDVGNCSRLWTKEDIGKAIKSNLGTKEKKGHRDFNLPPGPRCLRWTEYPLKPLSSRARLHELVDLRMSHIKLKNLWNKRPFLKNLRFLTPSYSKNLIKTHHFSEIPNLEELKFEGCENLVDVLPSIGHLKKLQALDLKGCRNLEGCENLVDVHPSIGQLEKLQALDLKGCRNLVRLPPSIHYLNCFQAIDVSGYSKSASFLEMLNKTEGSKKLIASETNIIEMLHSVRGCKMSTWKHDIFLSFSGEDTRRGFTSHLYRALTRTGFRVFLDDEELRSGEVISQELLQAIEESSVAIVILSKNYASSSWCLDELQHILASRDKLGQTVFPIFDHVRPSDVRKQQESVGDAFAILERRFQHDQPKVQKWRNSLEEVADLSGFDSSNFRTEAELIDNVVERLCSQLYSVRPSISESDALIGIEQRVDEMLSISGIGLDDVRFIGIWGMGGVGKTTLARAIYWRLLHLFDFPCFLANVREVSETKNGLVRLQNQLLSDLNVKSLRIEDMHQGQNTLGHLLRNRKVMLILDDVNDIRQLENLAGSREWFGDGSRIFITTRDVHLLKSHVVDEKYEVKPMNHDESFHLFCQKAFKGRSVPDEEKFRQLALLAINYAKGLPLALSVLGSFFSGLDGLTDWEDALKMLREDPDNDIFKTLRISYNQLSYAEKMIFLDIACFFNMWGKDEIIRILESCGLPIRTGLQTLMGKSLLAEVEIGNTTYIEMHDLVQEMGRHIVTEESPVNIGKRNRLWFPDDIVQLLERDMGTDATEAVVLPHTFDKDVVYWNPAAFLKMRWLRLLIISCNFDLPLHLKGLPWTLKVLHWYGYPSESLPFNANMDRLVYLKMHNSKIKYLSNDKQPMKNLKTMDLSHSKNLLQTPNLVRFQNLTRLVLEGCTSLVEVHSSLGQHHCLVEVNLKSCLNLEVLPKKLEMDSLEKLVLYGCVQVRNLPEFGENMEKLTILDVQKTSIAKLPESLGFLTGIETLDLGGCQNLVGLPHNVHKLKHLKVLDISGCSTFSELPKNLHENEALEKLDASGTAIIEVPSSVCHLKKLKRLAFHGCKKPTSNPCIWPLLWNQMFQRHSFPKGLTLPPSIFNIESLTELDLSYCNIVDGIIPNDLSGLSSLQKLDLSGNEFVNLPNGCISNLLNLQSLYLNSCPKLQFLPQTSPSLNLMDAGECDSLRTLSSKKMLRLFASIEQDGQHAEGLRRITTFSVSISGSEIPPWFENPNHLPLNEKHVASVTIDIPEDEWLGIGLCTVIDDKICLPRWGFEFKACDGKYVSLPGRTREDEKEIKSCHLWMVFWKIKEENRDELSKNYKQIRLKFCADWERPPSRMADVGSIKCGWRFIRKGDLEGVEDGENTIDSEGEEHGQCSLSHSENSQCIMRECESMPSESSSLCSEDEVKDDSWMQFISDDARFWF